MQNSQKGFTLIELIVVIVLLGILGVTALGKFQDLSGDAERAAVNAIATEITGGSTINYAKSLVSTSFLFDIGDTVAGSGDTEINTTVAGAGCAAALSGLLSNGAFPAVSGLAVTVTGGTGTGAAATACTTAGGAGSSYTCELQLGGNSLVPAVLTNITCTE